MHVHVCALVREIRKMRYLDFPRDAPVSDTYYAMRLRLVAHTRRDETTLQRDAGTRQTTQLPPGFPRNVLGVRNKIGWADQKLEVQRYLNFRLRYDIVDEDRITSFLCSDVSRVFNPELFPIISSDCLSAYKIAAILT